MKHVIGVADMKLSTCKGDVLVTHGLGSCLGVTLHDPVAAVGGMLHVMLPQAEVNPDKARECPCMFVDTGLPLLFRMVEQAGAVRSRCRLKVAGGANVNGAAGDHFAIGRRNIVMLKRMLWKNNILIEAEDTGGQQARTLYLEIGSGRTWMNVAGADKEL